MPNESKTPHVWDQENYERIYKVTIEAYVSLCDFEGLPENSMDAEQVVHEAVNATIVRVVEMVEPGNNQTGGA